MAPLVWALKLGWAAEMGGTSPFARFGPEVGQRNGWHLSLAPLVGPQKWVAPLARHLSLGQGPWKWVALLVLGGTSRFPEMGGTSRFTSRFLPSRFQGAGSSRHH